MAGDITAGTSGDITAGEKPGTAGVIVYAGIAGVIVYAGIPPVPCAYGSGSVIVPSLNVTLASRGFIASLTPVTVASTSIPPDTDPVTAGTAGDTTAGTAGDITAGIAGDITAGIDPEPGTGQLKGGHALKPGVPGIAGVIVYAGTAGVIVYAGTAGVIV